MEVLAGIWIAQSPLKRRSAMEEKYEAYVECKLCGWTKVVPDTTGALHESEKLKELYKEYPVCPNCHDDEHYAFAKGTKPRSL